MAENIEKESCLQRDSAEHEGYAEASRSFHRIWKERDSAQPKLLEAILYKDNLNRAYKRVKANKGAHGVDGMTTEEALPYLREHQKELTDRIYKGKYTPSPVRRVEIPKPDGGVRKLGIPTVTDRVIQQAVTQQLTPRTRMRNLVKLGVSEHYATTIAYSRRKYWFISNNKAVVWALNKERLISSGFYDLATAYQSVHAGY